MRKLIRNVGMYAWIFLACTYSYYRRGIRRIEWFFLYRTMRANYQATAAFGEAVVQTFLEKKDITGISVKLCKSRGYWDERTFYWEAPLTCTVCAKGAPVFGMAVEFYGKILRIRQLQGMAGAHIPKELSDWPKLFVRACMSFAEVEGLHEVRMYHADQSLFYLFPSLEPKEGESLTEAIQAFQKRMRRRYEGTARQLGFAKKRRWHSWCNPR